MRWSRGLQVRLPQKQGPPATLPQFALGLLAVNGFPQSREL